MTDLEMLRAVCENTTALMALDEKDYHTAKAIRERLDATKPAHKPYVPSGVEPESTEAIVSRLPDPKNSPLKQRSNYSRR